MAIQKTVNLASGVAVTYHRIDAIAVRFNGTGLKPFTASIEVGSYLNGSTASSGKSPVSTQTIAVSLDVEPSRAALYTWLTAPLQYHAVTVPTLTNVNGAPTPGTTTVQQAATSDTGFSGATAV